MENSLRDISSCRKPTNAILSRIVDLGALYQHPVSSPQFPVPVLPLLFDPKYLADPWKFNIIFSLLYTFSPTSANSPFIHYQFYFPPKKNCFILFY